jgi:protein-S-isoprenylcysteine O-methyltransferase Ste14
VIQPDTVLIQWVWVIVTLTWVVLAFRTKRTVARSGGYWRVVLVLGVFAVATSNLLTGESWRRHLWRVDSALSVTATILVVLGAAFAIWARLTIGTNWSGIVTLKENHELVVTGPYRFARHPIYTGLFTMGIGTALMYAEPYGFLLLVVAIVVFTFKIREEERLMTQNFPDQYPQYRRRVKAIIPFLL